MTLGPNLYMTGQLDRDLISLLLQLWPFLCITCYTAHVFHATIGATIGSADTRKCPFHHLLYCPCVPRHCWRHNWLSRHKESLHPRDPFASPHVPETEMRALHAGTWSLGHPRVPETEMRALQASTWSSVSPIVPETEMVATFSMCSLWCSWCCIQRDICPWPVCCSSQNARPLLVSFLSVNWLQKFYLSSGHVEFDDLIRNTLLSFTFHKTILSLNFSNSPCNSKCDFF